MAENRRCRVLVQKINDSPYNDFVGKYYHFPKYYLPQFEKLPLEFIYYSTQKDEGGYFGYGKIERPPFRDKREEDQFFVELSDYKVFSKKVELKDKDGFIREDENHYNAQNAVREIAPQKLDDICLEGGIQLTFKADAHLIKVLGEQLIASEKVGILELVKNAYDAQASYCRIIIEKVDVLPEAEDENPEFRQYPGPIIVIEDDGVGMTPDVIENGWLRPASTIKTNIKEKLKAEREIAIKNNTLDVYEKITKQLQKEYGNRIPLGEKGVGRFATHRLGSKLIMKTKVKGVPYEYVLKIDWDVFDSMGENGIDLDSIPIKLTKEPLPPKFSRIQCAGIKSHLDIHLGRQIPT